MSPLDPKPKLFEARERVSAAAAARIWDAWNDVATWPVWDHSLSSTQARESGLSLGKTFAVSPKTVPISIPVTVTAFEEGRHFTTSSQGPFGLMSIGHALVPAADGQSIELIHSICAVPGEAGGVPEPIWARLTADLARSVAALAALTTGVSSEAIA